MRTAVRGHDNPALDVALHLGASLDVPVLVYHGLSERYPYASDRHHTFVLEGARDVANELSTLGVRHVFHLEREGHRQPALMQLAEEAALVVTEEMPVAPLKYWTEKVGTVAPVWAVDTACVAPMRLSPEAFQRAFAFRRWAQPLWNLHLAEAWPPGPVGPVDDMSVPFQPVHLATADLAKYVSQCDIDHTVFPVPHTAGGSCAGYARWQQFLNDGLKLYHKRRNTATIAGVSRMSAYLHYGQVSPFRLARDCQQRGGGGAEKYLDELLCWRELAYHFCYHEPDHEDLSAVPEWARSGLKRHEGEPRPLLASWETLARGKTGDRLWDAAQTSLLVHGELHNNVRMTWGKAFLKWTRDAAEGLSRAIDLNHRYALDGRDPSSYGGILWCFGAFDRPFRPEQPILGPVRPRPTEDHAKRLDMQTYRRQCYRPAQATRSVGVIGGGLAGLTCARVLSDHRYPVTVFDKGRGFGGRTSTRQGTDGLQYDHGAQFFTARGEWLRRHVDAWLADGVVAPWKGRFRERRNGHDTPMSDETRYVGTPTMNAVTRHLGRDLDIRFGMPVTSLQRIQNRWEVTIGEEVYTFEHVVLAVPAPQALHLLRSSAIDSHLQVLNKVRFAPCWALMAEVAADVDFDGLRSDHPVLAWLARDSSKPGRPPLAETWVAHARADFSARYLEATREDMVSVLAEALTEILEASPTACVAHRWRHALVTQAVGHPCVALPEMGLVLCGDYMLGGRIEAAIASGAAAAGRLAAF